MNLRKITLGELGEEPVLSKRLQRLQLYMQCTLLKSRVEHEDVVHVNNTTVLQRFKDGIHCPLKSTGCIGQPERHDKNLVVAKRRPERCLGSSFSPTHT
jgi:hypothetical protein